MKVENDNKEPVTDLIRLALGYSNHGIQKSLSNDLGAGANAASRIDMTFLATDPLSELVWSPQKGPCLRCTDCSFADKKHSLFWGAGPSCVVLSPKQMNTSTNEDESNLNNSISTFHHLNANVSNRDNAEKSAWNDDGMELRQEKQTDNNNSFQGNAGFVEEVNTKGGESDQNIIEKNDSVNSKDVNAFCPNYSQEAKIAEAVEDSFLGSQDERNPHLALFKSLFEDPATEARDVDSGDKMSRMEIVSASGVQNENICETSEHSEKSLTSPGRIPEGSASLMDRKGKRKMAGISSPWTLEKLEATAENDLQTLIGDNKYVATSKVSGSESSSEVEENFQHGNKEKTLSDENVKILMSKEDDDDSHESVESCNNAGLLSRGKRRWGFEQQLTVGSKKVKKQIYDSPCSSSLVKQDSSFMNWISNMMKGFFRSKYEMPSLALTFPDPNQSHESSEKIVDINKKNQDLGCKNTGLELSDKVCHIDATPISCHGEKFNLQNVFPLSNDRFKVATSGGQAGQRSQTKVSSLNLSTSKRGSEGNSAENKNSCNLAVGMEKNRASSTSLDKLNEINTENIDSVAPSEENKIHNIDYKSKYLQSLWITRFSPKSSSYLLNQDTNGVDCMKLIPCSPFNVNVSSNQKIVKARQQSSEEPASFGFTSKRWVQHDQKLKCNMSSFSPFPILKDSEVIASTFARRLDALKNITASVSDNTASSIITCFFCGRKGHHSQCYSRFEENKKQSDENKGDIAAGTGCMAIDTGKDPNSNYGVTTDKIRSAKYVDNTYIASSSRENKLKQNQITALVSFINLQVSDMPKAIFNAVKMLRLTRTDILKWMSSKISLSHLEGFFLRLRLVKREEGLGGTGYHVACISGAHQQSTEQNFKNSISVNVGGTKCLVESQYISNHDFLEDELTTWWRATTKSGGKIPSKEELTKKVKERRLLGF